VPSTSLSRCDIVTGMQSEKVSINDVLHWTTIYCLWLAVIGEKIGNLL
jgi:hypothetical protein